MVVKFKLGGGVSPDLCEFRIIRLNGEKVDLRVDDSGVFADMRGVFHKDDRENSKTLATVFDMTIGDESDNESEDEKENYIDLTSD